MTKHELDSGPRGNCEGVDVCAHLRTTKKAAVKFFSAMPAREKNSNNTKNLSAIAARAPFALSDSKGQWGDTKPDWRAVRRMPIRLQPGARPFQSDIHLSRNCRPTGHIGLSGQSSVVGSCKTYISSPHPCSSHAGQTVDYGMPPA